MIPSHHISDFCYCSITAGQECVPGPVTKQKNEHTTLYPSHFITQPPPSSYLSSSHPIKFLSPTLDFHAFISQTSLISFFLCMLPLFVVCLAFLSVSSHLTQTLLSLIYSYFLLVVPRFISHISLSYYFFLLISCPIFHSLAWCRLDLCCGSLPSHSYLSYIPV